LDLASHVVRVRRFWLVINCYIYFFFYLDEWFIYVVKSDHINRFKTSPKPKILASLALSIGLQFKYSLLKSVPVIFVLVYYFIQFKYSFWNQSLKSNPIIHYDFLLFIQTINTACQFHILATILNIYITLNFYQGLNKEQWRDIWNKK